MLAPKSFTPNEFLKKGNFNYRLKFSNGNKIKHLYGNKLKRIDGISLHLMIDFSDNLNTVYTTSSLYLDAVNLGKWISELELVEIMDEFVYKKTIYLNSSLEDNMKLTVKIGDITHDFDFRFEYDNNTIYMRAQE